jgi:AraC family transcriptional regulator
MTLQPKIIELEGKKLIGIVIQMNLVQNRTTELWKRFRPICSEIKNRVSEEFISLQNYPIAYFEHFQPTKTFVKWACVEVTSFVSIPDGMECITLTGGHYAVFDYRGSSADPSIFQYIYGEWIPKSDYQLDDRPHFEVLGTNYRNNDPTSEEEIWIPILKK